MDWINVIAYGVSGAIGALLVYPFLGRKKEQRVVYTVVSLAALYIIPSILSVSALPLFYSWQMDRELKKNPFYSQLAESSPQVYEKVRAATLEGFRKQEPQATTEAKIASLVAGVMPQYLPTASDESVIAFVKATTSELRELDGSSPDSCYFFMFPQKAPASVANSVNDEAKSRMLDAMGGVIASATHAPQAPPDKEESNALMLSVARELRQKYGADIGILQREAKDTTERGKACIISIDLHERILSMPPRQASELLRYMLSSQ